MRDLLHQPESEAGLRGEGPDRLTSSPGRIEAQLKAEARRLGFTLVGIAPATEADTFPQFEAWLDKGYCGEMAYLPKRREARRHPSSILPTVRSVVMLGYEYGSGPDDDPRPGQVARYARGPDYHEHLWQKLNLLRDWLKSALPESEAHGVTDTAPLLERDFARRAGLGWFGKNTMLINRDRGSFFFLAALLTSAALQPDPPQATSHCGTCTRCLDACPTEAFVQPGVLDARRCISYLTIELRSPIPLELRPLVGDHLFGCDICQTVCPWNRRADSRGPLDFPANREFARLDPVEILGLTDVQFRQRFGGTSLSRTRRRGLVRNAAIVLGNVGDRSALPALEQAARDPDPVIAEAASWAREAILRRSPV